MIGDSFAIQKQATGLFPKITFGIIVLNGEPFTRYCLRGLYPFAHEIIVVEGGSSRANAIATSTGHSIDETLEALRRFKAEEDTQKKLQIVTKDGFWSEKDEQSQAYAERATGDYLWQVDIDEFYHPEDIQKILRILSDDRSISGMSFHWKNFWGGFDYLSDGWEYQRLVKRMNGMRRIFRWGKGYKYLTHRPPTVLDEADCDLCSLHWLGPDETAKRGLFCYHYGMVFPKQAKNKTIYYNKMWETHEDMHLWHEESFQRLSRPYRILHGGKPPSWLIRFEGKHPPAIKNLMEDIAESRIRTERRKTDDIEILLNSFRYRLSTRALKLLFPVATAFRNLYSSKPVRMLIFPLIFLKRSFKKLAGIAS